MTMMMNNQALPQEANQPVTILLVEDDRGHAELVKLNLKRSGIGNEIKQFDNGQEVLDFLAEQTSIGKKFLMILDINMPGVNGLQVLNRVKGSVQTKSIPIIVLTTATDEREAEYCYDLGCNVFMTKPMDYEAFCAAIHRLGMFLKIARFAGSKKGDAGIEQDQYVVYY